MSSYRPASGPSNACSPEYPLSYGQHSLWFYQRLFPDSCAYNLAYAARMPVEVDPGAFRSAVELFQVRHRALRTTFHGRNGSPYQRVQAAADAGLMVEDAEGWPAGRLAERIAEEVYRPFQLERECGFRSLLVRLGRADYVYMPVLHHIVADLWSAALYTHSLPVLYTALKRGLAPPGERGGAEYTDFVARQRAMVAGPEGERQREYWKRRLEGAAWCLELPADRARPPVQTWKGRAETVDLGGDLADALRSLARSRGTTLFALSLAAFHVLLHRYTGQTDIVVSTPRAGRTAEFARVFGYFINPLPVRADLSGNPRFTSFLQQIRDRVTEALAHGEYPFPLMLEPLRLPHDASRPPLAQVAFAWQKTTKLAGRDFAAFALNGGGGTSGWGEMPLESYPLEARVAPYEMTLQMGEVGAALRATVEYNSGLFEAATMQRMLGRLRRLLEGVAARPEQRIGSLPLLDEAERRRVAFGRDGSGKTGGGEPVHEAFERLAEARPDAAAVEWGERRWSYGDLNRSANRLARRLRAMGVGPESLVGVRIARSALLPLSMLAVLKAGGAFLPLDPSHPAGRASLMLRDAAAAALIEERWDPALEFAGARFAFDKEGPAMAAESGGSPGRIAGVDNLAYAIYTSGSTGAPKAVLLEHRGLANLVRADGGLLGIDERSRVLQFASPSFDACVWEVFSAFAAGAALVVPGAGELLAPGPSLARFLRDRAITHVVLAPSALAVTPRAELPELGTVIAGGEPCTREVVARWSQGRRFLNAYGPTEATVCASMAKCDGSSEDAPPIGWPLGNVRLYILNGSLEPAPDGVTGELYIGGAGVARGYLRRPEITAERFLPDPFADEPGARFYRTGDLARRRADGAIEFRGRADRQVKVRGFRIEPGEIEAALERHPAVRAAAVTADGNGGLTAYTISEGDAGQAELAHWLRRTLPAYMIPTAFVALERFPRSASGKIDYKALPRPEAPRSGEPVEAASAGLEQTICAVWKEALGVDCVDVQQNFFDVGGHSLLLAKVHAALEERLGRELPLLDLYRFPTVSALAAHLGRGGGAESADGATRERAEWQRFGLRERAAARERIAKRVS